MTTTTLLEAHNLTKQYGGNKGVTDITISITSGEMVGFIGPNGAGKSTTLNMLNGMLVPDSGNFLLLGHAVNWLTIHTLYPEIGVLLSEVAYDPTLKPKDIFIESAALLGVSDTNYWKELADHLELDVHKPFGELSLGNRKKVGFVNALLHKPQLVLMDEPTSGFDPLIQSRCMQLLQEVQKRGGAVLLSSHILSEVQSYCNRIIMLKEGVIIFESETSKLLDQAQRLFRIKSPSEQLQHAIHDTVAITKYQVLGDECLYYTTEYEKMIAVLYANQITDFFVERPSLEEMFMQYY